MRRFKILAVILALVLVISSLFIACNKDDGKTTSTTKKSSISKTTSNNDEDPDAWWKQYTTQPSPKINKTTAKNSSATANSLSAANKSSSAANKSSSDSGSADTTKGGGTTAKTAQSSYTRVDQYTMTYNNGGGGKTTLTYYPNNKFIKAAISDLSSGRGESYSANQMMYYSYTYKNKSGSLSQEDIVFVYSSSSRSNSTLAYTINYNTDAKLKPVLGGSNEYAFFPYAGSGTSSYNTYRSNYINQMEKIKKGYYDEVKSAYTSVGSQENVKVFLSW